MDELARSESGSQQYPDLKKSVEDLVATKQPFAKQIEEFERKAASGIKDELKKKVQAINGVNVIAEVFSSIRRRR